MVKLRNVGTVHQYLGSSNPALEMAQQVRLTSHHRRSGESFFLPPRTLLKPWSVSFLQKFFQLNSGQNWDAQVLPAQGLSNKFFHRPNRTKLLWLCVLMRCSPNRAYSRSRMPFPQWMEMKPKKSTQWWVKMATVKDLKTGNIFETMWVLVQSAACQSPVEFHNMSPSPPPVPWSRSEEAEGDWAGRPWIEAITLGFVNVVLHNKKQKSSN